MLGASPASPRLPPAVGSPADGTSRPPSWDSPWPSAGSYGSGSTSLTTAPRRRSSPSLATLPCSLVRSHARSPCTPLCGHVLDTLIGSRRRDRVVTVELRVLEVLVVLRGLAVRVGLTGVLRALPGAGQLGVGVPRALEGLLEL